MEQATQARGIVKTYNPVKGFGFVAIDALGGSDAYFNVHSLPAELKNGNYDESFLKFVDRLVAFNLIQTPDGKYQARDIYLVPMQPEDQLVGTVKSFSETGMYGFITTTSVDQDVFFKLKFPPQQRVVGAIARFCLHTTPDGKTQANTVFFKQHAPAGGAHQMGMMGGPAMQRGSSLEMGMMVKMMQSIGTQGRQGNEPDECMARRGDSGASGVVNYFNEEKGYGFIQSSDVAGDVFFKSDTPIEAGTAVSFNLRITPDGKPQGNSVVALLAAGTQTIGQIKFFNKLKGYGFLEVPGQSADVFFKAQALPSELHDMDGDTLQGVLLEFTVHITPDGKMQTNSASFARPAGGNASGGLSGNKRPASAAFGNQGARKFTKVEAAVVCSVKSFNGKKGWGFLESPELPCDIYFKANMLPMEKQQIVVVGAMGLAQVSWTPDGKAQAAALELY